MANESTEYFEHLQSDRKFIHDLASPLMIAMGMVDSVKNKIQDEGLAQRLDKANNALAKMNDILKSRREELIEVMEKVEQG